MLRITIIGVLAGAVLGTVTDVAAQGADSDNVPERPAIYSPHVERTVSNARHLSMPTSRLQVVFGIGRWSYR